MRRRLVVIAFALGVIAAPFVLSLVGTITRLADAQDEVLVVIEPAPVTADTYLELVKQKIELLTVEELAHETEILRKELAELQATRKLREAEQRLEELIEQYPGSSAAEQARIMLKASLRPTPQPNTSPYNGPDDDFNRRPNQGPNSRRNVPTGAEELNPAGRPADPNKSRFDPETRY